MKAPKRTTTAPPPKGAAIRMVVAKDLQPGDALETLAGPRTIKAVAIYAGKASISFTDGRAGMLRDAHEELGTVVGERDEEHRPIGKPAKPRKRDNRKPRKAHQGGDVLPDGTMVADPTNALLELHDQVNGTPAPPQVVPAPERPTLTELAKPFGRDRRQREVVKRRFRSLYGKLTAWPADQRAAFIAFITNNP